METNGSSDLKRFVDQRASWGDSVLGKLTLTMDYKLASSGMENRMRTGNFSLLSLEDTVKFVVGSRDDLERMNEVVASFDLTKNVSVYVSPVFEQLDPAEIVEFMRSKGLGKVTLQLQLHRIIWPNCSRGV